MTIINLEFGIMRFLLDCPGWSAGPHEFWGFEEDCRKGIWEGEPEKFVSDLRIF
jgi:hypothetical protein